MIAAAAIVDAVAVVLMLRLTKSLMVLQLVISVAEGMEVVVDATFCLWLTVTACTLRPIPIKQTIEMFGRDCILPNLALLWALWIELLGPTKKDCSIDIFHQRIGLFADCHGQSECLHEGPRVLVCFVVFSKALKVLGPGVA